MNKKTTPSHQQCPKEKNSVESKRPRVSEQTLAFLRSLPVTIMWNSNCHKGYKGLYWDKFVTSVYSLYFCIIVLNL